MYFHANVPAIDKSSEFRLEFVIKLDSLLLVVFSFKFYIFKFGKLFRKIKWRIWKKSVNSDLNNEFIPIPTAPIV